MRILLIIIPVLFSFVPPALACRYEARPFDEQLKDASTVFIGTVSTVENGQATFTIEKGLKGVDDAKDPKETRTFDSEVLRDSCGIRFSPGQRWLYLGNTQPSGSLLLMDEYGRMVPDNVALAQKKFGDFPADGSEVRHGTLERSCAPWDGAAFAITLDNGVSASVYVSPGDLDRKAKNEVVSYQADGKPEQGHASILQCPKPRDGQAENLPCQSLQGTIYIGQTTDTDAAGYIEITYGAENHARHVFHVRRINKQVFCG